MPVNWTPLWLGLRVAGVATAGALVPGLWLAYLLGTRRFAGGWAAKAILALWLAFPVIILAWLFGRDGLSWQGGAIAGVGTALPLIALGVLATFRNLDREYGNAVRSLGISEWRIFWRVLLPLGWRPVLAASAVAFARVLMEWNIVTAL